MTRKTRASSSYVGDDFFVFAKMAPLLPEDEFIKVGRRGVAGRKFTILQLAEKCLKKNTTNFLFIINYQNDL